MCREEPRSKSLGTFRDCFTMFDKDMGLLVLGLAGVGLEYESERQHLL